MASSMYRGQPSDSVMKLSGFMAYKMAQYVQESFEDYFREFPVKARHFCVMKVLNADGPMTQQSLCDALWIDRATMVGVIQVLVEPEFVSKKSAADDKRCFVIALTSKGKKFYLKYREGFEKLDRQIFAGHHSFDNPELSGYIPPMISALQYKDYQSYLRELIAEWHHFAI